MKGKVWIQLKAAPLNTMAADGAQGLPSAGGPEEMVCLLMQLYI